MGQPTPHIRVQYLPGTDFFHFYNFTDDNLTFMFFVGFFEVGSKGEFCHR